MCSVLSVRAVLAGLFCMQAFAATSEIDRAFARLYNSDYAGAHRIINHYIGLQPGDPVGYSVRAATYLFSELDRLGILEAEFFTDDKRLVEKKKLKPEPAIRTEFFKASDEAQRIAQARLSAKLDDTNALFAITIAMSLVADYTALIDKRQLGSLAWTKRTYHYSRRLLQADPQFFDAYVSTGVTEYLIGSVPFFIRWFLRFDDVRGNKEKGISNLELAARSGHYLRPFAKILLSIVYAREKKLDETERLLAELVREFPENPLMHRELEKVTEIRRRGGSGK